MKRLIPVLPIPHVVFYPHTALPIYVIEPVYIKMIREAAENDILVGIAMADEKTANLSYRTQYFPRSVCSLGRPIILEELPDGTLKVLIKGECRVHLTQVQQNLPYLIYEAEDFEDKTETRAIGEDKIERLTAILENWLLKNIEDSIERESFYQTITSINHIVDYLCMFLIQDASTRQLLLENNSLTERINMLNILLPGENPEFEDPVAASAFKDYEILEKMAKVGH